VRIDDGLRKEYTFKRAIKKRRRNTMDVSVLKELKDKAKGLTPEENLDLITHLLHRIRAAATDSMDRRKWSEICGKAPYPLVDEDAQAWVRRKRKESDERRQKNWR
jgi:hypothetical protein